MREDIRSQFIGPGKLQDMFIKKDDDEAIQVVADIRTAQNFHSSIELKLRELQDELDVKREIKLSKTRAHALLRCPQKLKYYRFESLCRTVIVDTS